MKSWNSLHNVAIPTLVAFIEAGWVWAWFSAAANLSPGVPADIPFLALALPALIAVAISAMAARLPWAWWFRAALLVPVAVCVAAVSAGVIGALYEHCSFSTLALSPWSATGHASGAEATVAWFAAILAVGRGTWLGCRELNLSDAVRSVGLAAVAYILFFIVCSFHHTHSGFHPNVGVSGALLLVSFPAAISVVALVHERELERTSLRQQRSRPSLAWLGAVIVPMAAVAGVGALVALVVGPLAPPIGRAIRTVVGWIADLINRLAHLFGGTVHAKRPPPTHSVGGNHVIVKLATPGHTPIWITIVASVVAGIVLAILLYFFVRELRRFRLRRQRGDGESAAVVEEKESVFSWSHLLEQLRGLLRRWFGRDGAGGGAAGMTLVSAIGDEGGVETVRRHYRRVLMAARSAGYGRATAETTFELRQRLAAVTDVEAEVALREMTVEYELVRYGEEPDQVEQLKRVRRHAEIVVAVLESTQLAEE